MLSNPTRGYGRPKPFFPVKTLLPVNGPLNLFKINFKSSKFGLIVAYMRQFKIVYTLPNCFYNMIIVICTCVCFIILKNRLHNYFTGVYHVMLCKENVNKIIRKYVWYSTDWFYVIFYDL